MQEVGSTLFTRLRATQSVRITGSCPDPQSKRPRPASAAFLRPGLEFLLAACVPMNSSTAPRRHGRITHQSPPSGPSYPQFSLPDLGFGLLSVLYCDAQRFHFFPATKAAQVYFRIRVLGRASTQPYLMHLLYLSAARIHPRTPVSFNIVGNNTWLGHVDGRLDIRLPKHIKSCTCGLRAMTPLACFPATPSVSAANWSSTTGSVIVVLVVLNSQEATVHEDFTLIDSRTTQGSWRSSCSTTRGCGARRLSY